MLLSMLMLLFTLVFVRLLLCSSWIWLLNLNLTFEQVISLNAEKTQLALFGRSNGVGAIDAKIDESVLDEKVFLSCCGCLSNLN